MTVAVITLALALASAIGALILLVVDFRRGQADLRHADADRIDELRLRLDAERRCDVEAARAVKAEKELADALVKLGSAQAATNAATAQEATRAHDAALTDPAGELRRQLATPLGAHATGHHPGDAGSDAVQPATPAGAGHGLASI